MITAGKMDAATTGMRISDTPGRIAATMTDTDASRNMDVMIRVGVMTGMIVITTGNPAEMPMVMDATSGRGTKDMNMTTGEAAAAGITVTTNRGRKRSARRSRIRAWKKMLL